MIIDQIKVNFQDAETLLQKFMSEPDIWDKIESAGNKNDIFLKIFINSF